MISNLAVFDLTDFSSVLGKRCLECNQDPPRRLSVHIEVTRQGQPQEQARTRVRPIRWTAGGLKQGRGCVWEAHIRPHRGGRRCSAPYTQEWGLIRSCFFRSFPRQLLSTLISELLASCCTIEGKVCKLVSAPDHWNGCVVVIPAAPVGEPAAGMEVIRRQETAQ